MSRNIGIAKGIATEQTTELQNKQGLTQCISGLQTRMRTIQNLAQKNRHAYTHLDCNSRLLHTQPHQSLPCCQPTRRTLQHHGCALGRLEARACKPAHAVALDGDGCGVQLVGAQLVKLCHVASTQEHLCAFLNVCVCVCVCGEIMGCICAGAELFHVASAKKHLCAFCVCVCVCVCACE